MTLSDNVMELAARVGGEFKATSGRIDALDALVEEAGATQTLSGQGGTITLSDGGGSVTIPEATAQSAGLMTPSAFASIPYLVGEFSNATADADAFTLVYRGSGGRASFSRVTLTDTPTEGDHAATKQYVDGEIAAVEAGEGVAQSIGLEGADTITLSGGGGSVTIPTATTVGPGLLSPADKERIDTAPTSDSVKNAINDAKVTVNVKDFGASGDGTTDDHAAVETALEHIRDVGGGTLIFPAGTYFINSVAAVYSNTTIEGAGATFVKKPGQGATMVFGVYSNGQTGYGAGARNVAFRGLRLVGDFTQKRQIGLLGANHADDVLVENCVFEQAHMQGHILDLGGCRRVTVRDCIFLGQNVFDASDPTKECIQADNSTRLGASNVEAPESYDGLPCEDVVVQNCQFLPITVDGVDYPSPVPFGTHWALESPHRRMVFEGNLVVDPPSNVGHPYRGVLHFTNSESVKVVNNRFVSFVATNETIVRNIPLTHTIDAEEAGTATGSTKTLSPPLQSSDIEFSGNVVTGFKAGSSPQTLVNIKGSNGSSRVNGVRVTGNQFTDAVTGESGPMAVELYDVNNATVSNNTASRIRAFLSIGRSYGVAVLGNSVDGGIVGGNILQVQGDTGGTSVSGNSIRSAGSGIAVQYSAKRFSVQGNSIETEGTGISVSSTAEGGAVTGNVSSSITISSASVEDTGNAVV